jgi:hypothetical protein
LKPGRVWWPAPAVRDDGPWEQFSGLRTGVFGPGELGHLRDEWGRRSSAPAFSSASSTAATRSSLLQPASGPATGGNSVVIWGDNLRGVTEVGFGSRAAPAFKSESATRLEVTVPPGGLSVRVPVTVQNVVGASNATQMYTYLRPTVARLEPTSGPASGGTSVRIMGSRFSGVTRVMFGATSATFLFEDGSHVLAIAPQGTAGRTVGVTVTTPLGTSFRTSSSTYHYT